MRILTIGGLRGFTSSFLVQQAVARGHRVTILTRGGAAPAYQADADLPAGVEVIVGDRVTDLAWVKGREWDAAVDFGAFDADAVDAITAGLRGRVRHYTLISSVAAYRRSPDVLDEGSAVLEDPRFGSAAEPGRSDVLRYGHGKVLAERHAAASGIRVLCVRPGIIVGPRDPLHHLQYWMGRWADGNAIAVPGDLDDPVQFVDSRDLAEWIVDMIERDQVGTYNVAGPAEPLTMGELMTMITDELGERRRLVWMSSRWLTERGIRCDLPYFWVKPDDARASDEFWLSFRVSDARARRNGYRSRSPESTIRETLATFRSGADAPLAGSPGWDPHIDETALIAAWDADHPSS